MSTVVNRVRPGLDPAVMFDIACLLCDDVPVDQVCQDLGLAQKDVTAAAFSMGYPDRGKLARSRDRWGQLASEEQDTAAAATRDERAARAAAARQDSAAAGLRFDDIKVSDLAPDPVNPRDDDEDDVADLAASIASAGLIQPIVARLAGSTLVVVAGHRRLRAVKRLGWVTVPVIVRREMTGDQVLATMLIENGQRKDLDPIQQARGLQALMRAAGDTSASQVAARVGRSQVWVSSRLALLALPAGDQAMLRRGEMTITEAVKRGRIESGRAAQPGSTGFPHFSNAHELSHLARARCTRLKHKARGRNSVGKVACGECWEAVIRANEREDLHAHATDDGVCPICQTRSQS